MSVVTFHFQANADGSASLTFDPQSVSPKHGVVALKKHTPIKVLLTPPAGVPVQILSALVTFDQQGGEGWPLAGQDAAAVTWTEDDHHIRVGDGAGIWKFGAVLLTTDPTKTYILPDPELHVGDGSWDVD